MLKIYSCDFGWAGGVVVVAESLEQAIKKMQSVRPCEQLDYVQIHDIEPGLAIVSWGDS